MGLCFLYATDVSGVAESFSPVSLSFFPFLDVLFVFITLNSSMHVKLAYVFVLFDSFAAVEAILLSRSVPYDR